MVFAGFYVVCLATTWFFYTRRSRGRARRPARDRAASERP